MKWLDYPKASDAGCRMQFIIIIIIIRYSRKLGKYLMVMASGGGRGGGGEVAYGGGIAKVSLMYYQSICEVGQQHCTLSCISA